MELVLHGTIVLLLSQVAGYAFFRAIHRSTQQDSARAGMWRMSHAACSAGAVFLIALGPVVPHLRLAPFAAAFLVDTLVASTYALSLGTVIAGFSGHRGTERRLPWSNLATYVLYVLGALGSTIAAVMLLYASARAYLAE
jgi:hypothetical protein